MTGKPGRYLTPEESVRLAMIHSIERDQLIEHIVKQLRQQAVGPVGTPRLGYSGKKRKAA